MVRTVLRVLFVVCLFVCFFVCLFVCLFVYSDCLFGRWLMLPIGAVKLIMCVCLYAWSQLCLDMLLCVVIHWKEVGQMVWLLLSARACVWNLGPKGRAWSSKSLPSPVLSFTSVSSYPQLVTHHLYHHEFRQAAYAALLLTLSPSRVKLITQILKSLVNLSNNAERRWRA